jgi:hypothetical protein
MVIMKGWVFGYVMPDYTVSCLRMIWHFLKILLSELFMFSQVYVWLESMSFTLITLQMWYPNFGYMG